MAISDKDRKLLWSRAGDRCAICKQPLTIDSTSSNTKSILGEECHIVARAPNGPRGSDRMDVEIDSYDNLVLLCPTDHRRIDEQPLDFPSTAIKIIKSLHESWVKKTLEEQWESETVTTRTKNMSENHDNATILSYKDASGVLRHVATGFLLELYDQDDLKMRITRNYLAKSVKLVESIFQLWDATAIQECHILFRCLLDRLFHIRKLLAENSFEAFDEWSFVEQYDFNARAFAEPRFKSQTDLLPPVPEADKQRRKELRNKTVGWVRPDAEEMANAIQRDYLYLYMFRSASMHIHPMANDGDRDYETVTGLRSTTVWPSQEYVLRNSILVLWTVLYDILFDLGVEATGTFRKFVDDLLVFLETGSQDYWRSYYALVESFKIGEPWFRLPQ
jgi:hypothetical protein